MSEVNLKDLSGHQLISGVNVFIPGDLSLCTGVPVLVFESSTKSLLYRDSRNMHSWTGKVWTYMVPPTIKREKAISLMEAAIPVVSKSDEIPIEDFPSHIFELQKTFGRILSSP